MNTDLRSNESVLCEILALKDLHIIDVGSGAGELVRYMTRQGAHVTGLECGALQLEKARSYPVEGDEVYVEGFGQELPFDDDTCDAVTFFNSLHHVPIEHMAGALNEATRVIRHDGMVYVAEPIAAGSGFELHAPIDDETEVRAKAYEAIRYAAKHGLVEEREVFYDTVYHHRDFADFKEDLIRIEPKRRALFEVSEDYLRSAFDQLGVAEESGFRFDQPMRVNVLKKTQ